MAEEGQRARNAGRLRDARERFRACVSDLCPALVRQDCGKWANDLSAAMPTIVVDARDNEGHDIADVKVSVDGEVITSRLNGEAIPVDPGPHTFKFERAGFAPVTEKAIIKEGVKARAFVVTLATPAAQVEAPESEPESPDADKVRTRKIIGGVSMGAGAVLGGLAVYELIHYLNLQSDLKAYAATIPQDPQGRQCRDTGDAKCVSIDKDSKTAVVLAAGFGAVGALALGFGAYMFFSQPPSDATPKPKTTIVPAVSVGSAGVVVLGTF